MALTTTEVRTISEPGRYSDGKGLLLVVGKTGARSWLQRITIDGKRCDIGLGSYPDINLKRARERALNNLDLVKEGIDPRTNDKVQSVPTLEQAAKEVIKLRKPGWKGGNQAKIWENSLTQHVFPTLGKTLVTDLTTSDFMDVLMPIWYSRHETAVRLVHRLSIIMRWTIGKGYRVDNPAGETLKAVLPKTGTMAQRNHQPSVHYSEVADIIGRVKRACTVNPVTKLAFEFLILTATRSSETRLATWDEFNLGKGVWSIPGKRTKNGRDHRIPLSTRALEVLKEVKGTNSDSSLVFSLTKGRPYHTATLARLMDYIGSTAVPHGFRTSFRVWASEQTSTPHSVMEAALGHIDPNKVVAAYARSDLFDRRSSLMQEWSDYLAS